MFSGKGLASCPAGTPDRGEAADCPGHIPVLRPLLPTAEQLTPYLRRIDATRIYANWGPLASEFERRLCEHFRLPAGCVVSSSSGTAALVGAILATAGRAGPNRPYAMVPAFTFVATAVAVEHCGFQPYLLDVGPHDWTIDPDTLAAHPLLSQVGVVVPVAAFGRALPQDRWLAFRRRTGIPVVIDAAAGFESLGEDPESLIGGVPAALSFHATKSLAIGEGGCVVCRDTAISGRVGQALNFGFAGSRSSGSPSTNGKLSEYHAAVGLAQLDVWPATRPALRAVADRYRLAFGPALANRFHGMPGVAGCYALFYCSSREESDGVRAGLVKAGVDYRQWYGDGLLQHPHFADASHEALPNTERLGQRLLGVPTAVDLSDEAIARVVRAVSDAVSPLGDRRPALEPI
jgi:dTDP-4-amino-4,6-dideoxygalactose transaminase